VGPGRTRPYFEKSIYFQLLKSQAASFIATENSHLPDCPSVAANGKETGVSQKSPPRCYHNAQGLASKPGAGVALGPCPHRAGLHPQLVAEREDELPILERYLPDVRYVGEVGLERDDSISAHIQRG
jgi:Tat protein secretion system quality control protein TatD with DNase activity